MKPREPRRQVMISARLRDGCGWSDARIINLSARGLLLHASKAPGRGSYVEVCKGPHRIIGRVVWVQQDRFGVRTQDPLPIEAITSGGGAKAPERAFHHPDRRLKRRVPDAAERLERSRARAHAMQFLWIAGMSVAAGTMVFGAVKGALSRPMSAVSAELTRID